jgi:Heterokaryon incompatibility protein (HET)
VGKWDGDFGSLTSEFSLPMAAPPSANMALRRFSTSFFRSSLVHGSIRYKYKPLVKADDIRIIQIFPGCGTEKLVCSIKHTSLDKGVPYDAISYTWGSSSQLKTMECHNEGHLQITETLHGALLRFRLRDCPVTFWVDQLCINQDDIIERSAQVRLMKTIFAQAKKVVIWLGPASQDSDAGIDLARRIFAVYDENPSADLSISNLHRLGLPEAWEDSWKALQALLLRPWFHRVWVIQEIAMSKRAIVVCGEQILPWDRLASLAQRLCFAMHMRKLGAVKENIFSAVTVVKRILETNQMRRRVLLGKKNDLLRLLIAYRGCKATDAKDKVFALLGLSKEDAAILPDYRRSVKEVYIDIARLIFKSAFDASPGTQRYVIFGIIYSAGSANQHYPPLPSWIPDWGCDLTTDPLWQPEEPIFHAGGESLGKTDLLPFDRIQLSGKVFDTITAVSMPLSFRNFPGIGARQWAKDAWLYSCVKLATSLPSVIYRTGETISEAFKRTLFANRISRGARYYKGTLHDAESRFGILTLPSELPVLEKQLLDWNGPPEPYSEEWWHNGLVEARGRALFVTGKGFIGLAPEGAKQGDRLAVLLGGDIPVVMRSAREGDGGSGWELVGECYVHGIMDGEVLRDDLIPVMDIIFV